MTPATMETTAGPRAIKTEAGRTVDQQKVLDLYPALAGLPTERRQALFQPQAIMQLPAGTQVFAEHQPCQGFPQLIEGSIKVAKLAASGRELVLYRVTPDRRLDAGTSVIGRPQDALILTESPP